MLSFIAGDITGSAFENLDYEEAKKHWDSLHHPGQTYTDETVIALGTAYWLLIPGAVEARQNPSRWLVPLLKEHREHFLDSGLLNLLQFPETFLMDKFRANVLSGMVAPIALWSSSDEECDQLIELAFTSLTTHPESLIAGKVLGKMLRWSYLPEFRENPRYLGTALNERFPDFFAEEVDIEHEKNHHLFNNQFPFLVRLCNQFLLHHEETLTITSLLQSILKLYGNASSQLAVLGMIHEGLYGLDEEFVQSKILQKSFFFDQRFPNLLYAFFKNERVQQFYAKNERSIPDLHTWLNSVPQN